MKFLKFCSIKSQAFLYEATDLGVKNTFYSMQNTVELIHQVHPKMMLYLFYCISEIDIWLTGNNRT